MILGLSLTWLIILACFLASFLFFGPIFLSIKACIDRCAGFSRPCVYPAFCPEQELGNDAENQKEEEQSMLTPCIPWCSYLIWYLIVSVLLSGVLTFVVFQIVAWWVAETFPPLVPPVFDPPSQATTTTASFTVQSTMGAKPLTDSLQQALDSQRRYLEETIGGQDCTAACTGAGGGIKECSVACTLAQEINSQNVPQGLESDLQAAIQDWSDDSQATIVGSIETDVATTVFCDEATDEELAIMLDPWKQNLAEYGDIEKALEDFGSCENMANPPDIALEEMKNPDSEARQMLNEFQDLPGVDPIVEFPQNDDYTDFCGFTVGGIMGSYVCPQSCGAGECGQPTM